MSDKTPKERKISFRLNDFLYRFISQYASERKIETSEAVRMFCQNYYMDFMKSQIEKKQLQPVEQKRQRFLELISTIGTKDMKRILRNPEICTLVNGMMMEDGRNKKKKLMARA